MQIWCATVVIHKKGTHHLKIVTVHNIVVAGDDDDQIKAHTPNIKRALRYSTLVGKDKDEPGLWAIKEIFRGKKLGDSNE